MLDDVLHPQPLQPLAHVEVEPRQLGLALLPRPRRERAVHQRLREVNLLAEGALAAAAGAAARAGAALKLGEQYGLQDLVVLHVLEGDAPQLQGHEPAQQVHKRAAVRHLRGGGSRGEGGVSTS